MATTIKVTGLRELQARLDLLKTEVQLKLAARATAAAAAVVKKSAKQRAPVADEPYEFEGVLVQPGNIARNIISKRLRNTSHTAEHIVAVRGKKKYGYASRVGALQEFGTVKQSPQPFLRPAFEANLGKAIDAMKKNLAAGIAKAAKGGKS